MINLLKIFRHTFVEKSMKYTFAIISLLFIFIPEEIFKNAILSSEYVKKVALLENYTPEINIVVNRVLVFIIIWCLVKIYLSRRKEIIINGNNYKIIIEYNDLLTIKNCKRVISFDECFSTKVSNAPADIKKTSICGQYLEANPELDIHLLLSNSQLKPLNTKSKYQNKDRYESGRIVANGDDLLLAFAKLDEDGVGRLTHDEYLKCLSILWKEIDNNYGQQDVCIPILGAGLTRFDGGSGASISQQELLNMMIWSYKLSSHKIKLPYKLRIICKRNKNFSLDKIDSQTS